MYTTCMNCGRKCKEYELDINSECWSCQFSFEGKMREIRKNTDLTNSNKAKSYYETIPSEYRMNLMRDAMNLYKVKFKNKNLLIDFLNEKYNESLTRNIFNNITSPRHLAKLGLSWKFELQKLKRIK